MSKVRELSEKHWQKWQHVNNLKIHQYAQLIFKVTRT